MTMTTELSSLTNLFETKFFGNVVLLTVTSASVPQARALANMLNRSRALGEFRHTQNLDGGDMQLTFFKATLVRVNAFIASVTIEQLSAEVAMIERVAVQYAAVLAEEERVNSLHFRDFGQLLCSRSSGKLLMTDFHDQTKLVLKTLVLIPVTHFKTLAKLTKYDGKAKTFTIGIRDLNASIRDKLLRLADTLAKSTKKITIEDIAERRARRGQYTHLPREELERLVEDHMYDVFGHDSPENRRMSREAFAKY
jgi:hypothetical protein